MSTIFTTTSSVALGALHALEPGHGKSLLTTFIAGKKLQWMQLFALIGSQLVSHFTFLLVLTIIFVQFGNIESFADLQWPKLVASVLIVLFGGYILFQANDQEHDLDCTCHEHQHKNWKQLGLTGFLAGLIPCPSAIVPIMMSGAEGNIPSAIQYLGLYIMGMAIALFLFVVGVAYLNHRLLPSWSNKVSARKFKRISGIIVILIGCYYMWHPIMHLSGWQ